MTSLAQAVTEVLSVFTILVHFLLFVVIIAALTPRNPASNRVIGLVQKHILALGFFTVASALASSLFYSVIANFTPCSLCWWQRIFLFPQLILFGLAFKKKDRAILPYVLWLSVIGGLIALYHTYIQFGGIQFLPCPATGISCTQRFFLEFGYITIPTMSLTIFVALITFLLIARKTRE